MVVAMCDDNADFLETLRAQLASVPYVDEIFAFSDIDAFLFSVDEGRRYDVVFMDIDWHREQAGIGAAEELYQMLPSAKVVYVTGYSDRFSQQIFLHKSNLSGFLTKPVSDELLRANLDKIAKSLTLQKQPTLVLRRRGSPVTLPLREIFFIESSGHMVLVHTVEETINCYERLEDLDALLPAGFYRCHKSYIVNMSQIRRFHAGEIVLKNGETVSVSRSRSAQTKEAYFKYMGKSF